MYVQSTVVSMSTTIDDSLLTISMHSFEKFLQVFRVLDDAINNIVQRRQIPTFVRIQDVMEAYLKEKLELYEIFAVQAICPGSHTFSLQESCDNNSRQDTVININLLWPKDNYNNNGGNQDAPKINKKRNPLMIESRLFTFRKLLEACILEDPTFIENSPLLSHASYLKFQQKYFPYLLLPNSSCSNAFPSSNSNNNDTPHPSQNSVKNNQYNNSKKRSIESILKLNPQTIKTTKYLTTSSSTSQNVLDDNLSNSASGTLTTSTQSTIHSTESAENLSSRDILNEMKNKINIRKNNEEANAIEIKRLENEFNHKQLLQSIPKVCELLRLLYISKKKSVFQLSLLISDFSTELKLSNYEVKKRLKELAKIVPEFVTIFPPDDFLLYETLHLNVNVPYDSVRQKIMNLNH